MRDTPPHVDEAYAAMFSRLTGTERLRLASDMFETAKALVIANIRATEPDLSPARLRVRLFERLYAGDFDERTQVAIVAALSSSE